MRQSAAATSQTTAATPIHARMQSRDCLGHAPNAGKLAVHDAALDFRHAIGGPGSERPAIDHWITSSARNSSDCGAVMPSAFAAFRLITSSICVGCSTGSSLGLAPLMILST